MLYLTFKDHFKIFMWKLLVLVTPWNWGLYKDRSDQTAHHRLAEKMIYKTIYQNKHLKMVKKKGESIINIKPNYEIGSLRIFDYDGDDMTLRLTGSNSEFLYEYVPSRWFLLVTNILIRKVEDGITRERREEIIKTFSEVVVNDSVL